MERYTTAKNNTLEVRDEGVNSYGTHLYTFTLREAKPLGEAITVLGFNLPLVTPDYFIKLYCEQY